MRPWRDIARQLTHESNRERIIELSEELNQALAEQGFLTADERVRTKSEDRDSEVSTTAEIKN
jgi:hypothetical protein